MPGNKPKLTKELIREASKYIGGGLTNRDTCAILGVSEGAFYKWLQEPRTGLEVELYDAIEKAKATRKAFMIQSITSAARGGTWQAAAWYLERQYPAEYARPDRYHDQGVTEAIQAVRELTESIKAQADAAHE